MVLPEVYLHLRCPQCSSDDGSSINLFAISLETTFAWVTASLSREWLYAVDDDILWVLMEALHGTVCIVFV